MVQEPGLVAVTPGIGLAMIAPVSVCHQVSTIGQRLLADHGVIPDPGLGIDGFADAAEQSQLGEVVLCRELVAELHQGAQGGRCGIEDGYAVLLADLPEAAAIRIHRRAFVHHDGGTGRQRAVTDIGVPGYPADIGGTPEDIIVVQVENPLRGELGAEQIAGGRMLYAFGFAGGAGGVEQEQRMLGADPGRFAAIALVLHHV